MRVVPFFLFSTLWSFILQKMIQIWPIMQYMGNYAVHYLGGSCTRRTVFFSSFILHIDDSEDLVPEGLFSFQPRCRLKLESVIKTLFSQKWSNKFVGDKIRNLVFSCCGSFHLMPLKWQIVLHRSKVNNITSGALQNYGYIKKILGFMRSSK